MAYPRLDFGAAHPVAPFVARQFPGVPVSDMQQHIRGILLALGEDPDRDGLQKTPERVEKAM